ncbi:hypothetical protein PENTCL1PPCAC_24238, partial [Pristionchus entomophagus]
LKLHETGDPSNIFHLCHPNSSESISYYKARERLLLVGRDGQTLIQTVNEFYLKSMTSHCLACETRRNGTGIILHFISMKHQTKVTELGAAVSRKA